MSFVTEAPEENLDRFTHQLFHTSFMLPSIKILSLKMTIYHVLMVLLEYFVAETTNIKSANAKGVKSSLL